MYITLRAAIMQSDTMFYIQKFQPAFSPLYCTLSNCILHEKSAYSVHTVCFALHRMCVKYRAFYRIISQRSCHVHYSPCSHNAIGHSWFTIQEFQAAFLPLYCTSSKCILHGKVHTVCIRCVFALQRMCVE